MWAAEYSTGTHNVIQTLEPTPHSQSWTYANVVVVINAAGDTNCVITYEALFISNVVVVQCGAWCSI